MSKDILKTTYCHLDTGFLVTPKNGTWTLEDQYEVMLECKAISCLQDVQPNPCAEGGFKFDKRLEEKDWHCAEIRTYSVRGSISCDDWRELLPLRDDFKTPMVIDKSPYQNSTLFTYAPIIEVRAKGWPSLEMVIELCKIFMKKGHFVWRTEGFRFEDASLSNVKVTRKFSLLPIGVRHKKSDIEKAVGARKRKANDW